MINFIFYTVFSYRFIHLFYILKIKLVFKFLKTKIYNSILLDFLIYTFTEQLMMIKHLFYILIIKLVFKFLKTKIYNSILLDFLIYTFTEQLM